MVSLLHLVPPEILSSIAATLAAARPLRPPADLCALRATCRHLRDALNSHYNPVAWVAAFDSRFDSAAVCRRNFSPNGRDYYDQLRQYAEVLDALRSGNVLRPDIGDLFRIVYVMLLDNNGKNRAQLEAAGIDLFLDTYIRTHLWSEAHLNAGWPPDDSTNSFALWIKWMLTTTEQLQRETAAAREEMVSLVMPFVLNPYRYVQAEAPPNHFHFPLPDRTNDFIHSFPSAHGPYPVYAPDRQVSYPYFGSLPYFSPPPLTVAAKLLYFARREILPFGIPPHIPATRALAPPSAAPSPTQEDLIEFNAHRGAEPPVRITWDWDSGTRLVNGVPDSQSSSTDRSSQWDSDYWRRRLCGNAWKRHPKWRPAKVYIPGSMDGLWQGRLIFPLQEAMQQLLRQAIFPPQDFNETSFRVTHQPIFMRLAEHHSLFPTQPTPFPPHEVPPQSQQANDDSSRWQDLSMRNAWFPGLPGSVNFENASSSSSSSLFSHPSSEEPQKTFVTIEGQGQSSSSWVYTNFDRDRQRQCRHHQQEAEHVGHESCSMCVEREQLYRKGVRLDLEDLDVINERYATGWEDMERMFESVGLGRDESSESSEDEEDMDEDEEDEDMDEDEDEDGCDEDVDIDDPEDEEIDFIEDPNAEVRKPFTTPVRRGTDRAKIEKCDGIRDIIFSGSTDKRHAQAWNHFTFYGRIRPWDGLIGILRRSHWPTQNFLFFYGYLVGGENFIGNWRLVAADPVSPTWESAFVMSRRKDDDGDV